MLRPPSITMESYFSTRNVANSRNMCSLKQPRFSSASGGPTRKKPSGSRVTKPSNSAWSMRVQILGHFHQRVLRSGAHLHGDVVAHPIQIDHHRVLLALRQHGGEIDRQRRGADAALGARGTCRPCRACSREEADALRRALEARHGVAKLGALQRLQQKFVGAGAHAGDHRLPVGVIVRRDHVEIGRGLLDLLQRLDAGLGIGGQVEIRPACGFRSRSCRTRIYRLAATSWNSEMTLAVGDVDEIVANHFPEVFVARGDHRERGLDIQGSDLTLYSLGKHVPVSSHPAPPMGTLAWKSGRDTAGSLKNPENLVN